MKIVPHVSMAGVIAPGDDSLYGDMGLERTYYNYYFSYGQSFRPKSVYEIGVRMGYTAYFMILGAGGSVSKYRGVDLETYRAGSSAHAQTLLRRKCANSVVSVGDSHQIQQLDQPYDLIHVDGDHSYAGKIADLELALRSLAPGGVIVVDDCHPKPPKHHVYRAVMDFVKSHDVQMEHLHPLCGSVLNPVNGHALLRRS